MPLQNAVQRRDRPCALDAIWRRVTAGRHYAVPAMGACADNGAAMSEQTRGWLASRGHGLLTTCHNLGQLERLIQALREADVRETVLVAADLGRLVKRLHGIRKLGVTIDIHNVGCKQSDFIEAFGRHALPKLRASA
jgi:hypothetical protein